MNKRNKFMLWGMIIIGLIRLQNFKYDGITFAYIIGWLLEAILGGALFGYIAYKIFGREKRKEV